MHPELEKIKTRGAERRCEIVVRGLVGIHENLLPWCDISLNIVKGSVCIVGSYRSSCGPYFVVSAQRSPEHRHSKRRGGKKCIQHEDGHKGTPDARLQVQSLENPGKNQIGQRRKMIEMGEIRPLREQSRKEQPRQNRG